MKVVLFCGGLGTRLREHSDVIPKPLVEIGNRPILWHLMKYYAYFGHKDFLLCLGYKSEMIKEYFSGYSRYKYSDFVMRKGERELLVTDDDVEDWTITFVDTGLHSNIGERLLAVQDFLRDEPVFLANYSDQLSDFRLPEIIDFHRQHSMIASVLGVRPLHSFHQIKVSGDGRVTDFGPARESQTWVNGGYMVLSREIFDHIEAGEELVEQPFGRIMQQGKLGSLTYTGFWAAMDTFKDKIMFDRMYARGNKPWEVWSDRQASDA